MRVIFLLFILFVVASAYRHGARERRPARPYRHDSREINRYNHKDMNRDRDDDSYEDTVDDSDEVAADEHFGQNAQNSDDDSGEYSDEEADEDSDDDSGEDSDEDSYEDEDAYYEPLPRQHINRRRQPPRFVRCFGPPLRSNGRLRPIR